MSDSERNAGRHLSLSIAALTTITLLVLSDSDRTFQWLLARALGLSLIYLGYGLFLWARQSAYWSEFFSGAVVAEVALRVVDLTPFRYLPPVLLLIWLRGVLLPLAYGAGFREVAPRPKDWTEWQVMGGCFAAGFILHHVVAAPLVDAVLALLMGRYP